MSNTWYKYTVLLSCITHNESCPKYHNHAPRSPMTPNCYMCDEPGTTVEHVPPKCLFPEDKDLPSGIKLRNSLITVPSCKTHNTRFCRDDEFLMYILVINLPANYTAFRHFRTKILRAVQRNPSLIKKLFANTHRVFVRSKPNGPLEPSLAYDIDEARFNAVLEKVARGIYYHHYNICWPGEIHVRPEFLVSIDQPNSIQTNILTQTITAASNMLFAGSPSYGANPSVFCYQVYDLPGKAPLMMRLRFYGEGCVTLIFNKRDLPTAHIPPETASGPSN